MCSNFFFSTDRKSTRLNSSLRHLVCRLLLEKKNRHTGPYCCTSPPPWPPPSGHPAPGPYSSSPAPVGCDRVLYCRRVFFFNDTATTEIYTLSLHDALPISWFPRLGAGFPASIRCIWTDQ